MTREEAIRRLGGMKSLYPYENNPHKEALDLAIESLRADTVSRSQYQGLLNAIGKVYIEVVRCKDCKHRIDRRLDLGHFMCGMLYGQGDVSDENFCQWGERREP